MDDEEQLAVDERQYADRLRRARYTLSECVRAQERAEEATNQARADMVAIRDDNLFLKRVRKDVRMELRDNADAGQ